jgi:hypothetical protein
MKWTSIAGAIVVAMLVGNIETAYAQPDKLDPVVSELDGRVRDFFERVSHAETGTAFQRILKGSTLAQQTEAVETLVTKTNELKKKYGEYRKSERISAKRVGEDVVLMRYLYKCEQYPVVWYFTFYRTPPRGNITATEIHAAASNWRVIAVRFDTDLDALDRP